MAISTISYRALHLLLLFITTAGVTSLQETSGNSTDFSCTPVGPCNTYVVYRARSPGLLDVRGISELFGVVDHWSVVQANSLASEDTQLVDGQQLLVPILCGCTGNRSFANITYRIKKDDTYFLMSTGAFEYLTDYFAVGDLNPSLNPYKLQIGVEVVFPIYCKCVTLAQMQQGSNFLITYVWQAGDTLDQVSRMMNSSSDAIVAANNGRNLTAAVDRPVLIPVTKLPNFPPPPPSTAPGGKKKRVAQKTTIIVSCAIGAALASVLWCFLFFMHRRCNRMGKFVHTLPGLESGGQVKKPRKDGNVSSPRSAQVDLLLTEVSDCLDKPAVYCVEDIMQGTGDLDEKCRIGGAVFRADIDGELLAVRKAKGDVSEELRILQRVNHANLVKLMGISTSSSGEFFLVYEYAENGSLDRWLHQMTASPPSSGGFLSWRQRLRIALDVASGLQYLHQHTSPGVVHGDIRATNILLDDHFKAKISNFSKAGPVAAAAATKTDVFAFGLLLLELITGRKSVEMGEDREVAMSWRDVRAVLEGEEGRGERLRRWMDPNMDGEYPLEGALSLAAMAKACTSERPWERPSMAEVAFGLSVLSESCMERPWTANVQIINPAFSP
ncbi:hypothetical protein Taro_046700 [Colocasia esculenta]|uniref:Protein kinase domain-containing protein n=1 Tax=Colocasia esculenta TaxID=4460 RepID=A0A843X6G3_COLES|nr:hypothetical protein [Colocasia esculenta]